MNVGRLLLGFWAAAALFASTVLIVSGRPEIADACPFNSGFTVGLSGGSIAQSCVAAPTPAPTPSGGGGGGGGLCNPPVLTPGQQYTTAFSPYCNSPWSTMISANPTVASWSQTLVNVEFANGNTCGGNCVVEARTGPGGDDAVAYSEIWYAQASDPIVTLTFSNGCFCDTTDNGGYPATIRIPTVARAGGGCGAGGDRGMAIIQPDGTEIDTAYGGACGGPAGNWRTGDNLDVGAAASCGNWVTNTLGWLQHGVVSASGRCLAAGRLRANELAAGHINHALALIGACGGSPGGASWQYPSDIGATTNNCTGGSGNGPPLGGRLWYDVPCATINALQLSTSEKAILCALHEYGGYNTDDVNGGVAYTGFGEFATDGGMTFWQYNGTVAGNPYSQLSDWTNCGQLVNIQTRFCIAGHGGGTGEWQPSAGHIGNGVGDPLDFKAHMKWLAECSARNTC